MHELTVVTLLAFIAVSQTFFAARAVAKWASWRSRPRVVVSLADGYTIAGTLLSRRGGEITVGGAAVTAPDGSSVTADGRVTVDIGRVLWVQRP